MEAPLGRIHLIADLDVLDGMPDGEDRVRRLLAAGLPSLTLRGPGRSSSALVEAGRRLRDLARRHGARFLVNGPEEAVRALNADGWHRPAADGPPPADWDRPWGGSAHDRQELDRARDAHWVFVSPVYPTLSKPGTVGLGAEGLAALVAETSVPAYALGGVDADRHAACLRAGAAGSAAIRGLLGDQGPDWVRGAVTA